ncbi:MAG: hypothetical protein JWP97_5668 [Labilithrix sp.]|nr:hypothetical protein [Labilithrix sp.]
MSYALRAATGPSDPDAAAALALFEAEFGPRGELERPEVIAGWLAEPARGVVTAGGLRRAYRLLVARDASGTIAGVRDLHVVVDRAARLVVVYLAHVLVLPPFRRTGLGALLRRAPVELASSFMMEEGAEPLAMLLAAEMEPAGAAPESRVRLVAYGREGFAAIAPSFLPYVQPDFRALGPGDEPHPIPLLAVVRRVGAGADERRLPAGLARAFVRHLYAVFESHVPEAHLRAEERATLDVLEARLAAAGAEEVPLLPLPRVLDDEEAFAALGEDAVRAAFAGRRP